MRKTVSRPQLRQSMQGGGEDLANEEAGTYLALLRDGMMFGRFAGSLQMQKIDAAMILAEFSVGPLP